MSLKCAFKECSTYELVSANQLAFYQDINTNGWNFGLSPTYSTNNIPSSLVLVPTGDGRFPFDVVCNRCKKKVGKVNTVCGFQKQTINFSAKKVKLLQSRHIDGPVASKWSKVIDCFPQIRKLTATVQELVPLVGSNTVHFHGGIADFQEMINFGIQTANKSNHNPRRYQWRAYFFSCINNTLLCLSTGMGKTLIATMVMKAYYVRNPGQGQVFIVPTISLVEQQASVIEKSTGLKVIRRSSEHVNGDKIQWTAGDICTCTSAMLLNAIKLKQVDMSQFSLLILDEVHEAGSENSTYGKLLPYILKCLPTHRPRVVGLTASPSSSCSKDLRSNILTLCNRMGAKPYTPPEEPEKYEECPNNINCSYISISKSHFEIQFENFVFNFLEKLSQLHDYFKSNMKEIPQNIHIKCKIAAIVKIISNAHHYALHSNDLALQQINNWMSKIIDSLNVLQVFGPKKLIEFIKADLNFAKKNDAFSEISAKITPLIAYMTTAIHQMEISGSIQTDSPKMSALLAELKRYQNTDERILVFVDRRNAAERLCRRLRNDTEVGKMSPEFVVGTSGGDFSKEMQQEALRKFKRGECKVLVATSVLEQGIDVIACGVVICFDGVKSIKSIIQSRGRARKRSAKFIALVTDDKQLKTYELTKMEILMKQAIEQLMIECGSALDPELDAEIAKFLENGQDGVEPSLGNEDEDDDDDDDDDQEDYELDAGQSFIKFRLFNTYDADAIAYNISQFSHKQPKVRRNQVDAHFVVSEEDKFSEWNIIKKISSKTHAIVPVSALRAWIEAPDVVGDVKVARLDFDTLTTFHYEDATSVCLDKNAIWCGKLDMEIYGNQMFLKSGDKTFKIESIDMEGAILINDTYESLELFLTLRNPPSFYVTNHDELTVVGQIERSHFDFSTRTFNLHLKRCRAIKIQQSQTLRCALRNFSLDIFYGCHFKYKICEHRGNEYSKFENHSNFFIKTYMIKAWHCKHAAILPPNLPHHFLEKFYATPSVLELEVLLEATTPIRFKRMDVKTIKSFALPFADLRLGENYSMIGRVKITPYRVVFMPLAPTQKNRVFRYFPNPENFLIVTFTDEHFENPWKSVSIYQHFFNILLTGIAIGGKLFTFLGCSNSQLREGHCWFSCLDRQLVYNKIGEFPEDLSAGRKLTRLALAFASSVATVTLDNERYIRNVHPDIVCGGVVFSDGIGKASRNLFRKVGEKIPLPETVSALQIRVGGIKGVVSIHDDQIDDVHFRKSMKKFHSDHNLLELLQFNFPIPLHLNRHVVLLLTGFGIPGEVFIDFQHNDIFKCLEALVEDEKALEMVKKKTSNSSFQWELFDKNHLFSEPLFRHCVISNTVEIVSEIVHHAHISVPNGRILMGVLDETGTLNYGEVYAHVIENNLDMEIEGEVLIFRNPSVLPSDIRKLRARTDVSPRIKNLYRNCLVIPSRGQDSHARECSNGDLDGDLYYVIWEKQLIPGDNLPIPGRQVIEVETQEPHISQEKTNVVDMMQFFCNYAASNQLGVIANAHLAVADKFGMESDQAIALARYVTAETDAPRKGLTVGKIEPNLLPTEYPDYMRKSDKRTYKSTTVLGEMYRDASPVLDILLEKRQVISPRTRHSLVGGQTTNSVQHYYSIYSFEITKMLQCFELNSEVDLFSGTPMWTNSCYRSAYKQQAQLREIVKDTVSNFWKKWMEIFEKWRTKNNDVASILEWYNRPKACPTPVHSFAFLALPFIDCHRPQKRPTLIESIQTSVVRWIICNKMTWLNEYRIRFNAGKLIMSRLQEIDCHFYGSSMLALSEEYSDLDIYAAEPRMDVLRQKLKIIDAEAVNKEKPHACVCLTYESLPLDVTNFAHGVNKTYAMAEIFDSNPGIWPALRVLLEWARNVKIVKSGGSQGLMTVVSFCHLFIYTTVNTIQPAVRKQYSLGRYNEWIEGVHKSDCGGLIYNFLKFLADGKCSSWIEAQSEPFTGEPLIKSGLIDELCRHAEIAVYILAIHDGDISKLFQFSTKRRLFKIDKRYLNPSTTNDDQKSLALKELESKCNKDRSDVIMNIILRNGFFFLEAIGNYRQLANVENGLRSIHNRLMSSRLKGMRKRAYHIVGSSTIIPEFGFGLSTEVSFATYTGEHFHSQHAGLWKSSIFFRDEKNFKWRSAEYPRFKEHFNKQYQFFKSKQLLMRAYSGASRFFGDLQCNVTSGNSYMFNVPESLANTFETIDLATVQRNISAIEEKLILERHENIVREMKEYNPRTILKSETDSVNPKEPVKLMPMQEMKRHSTKQKQIDAIVNASKKKTGSVRSTFYPCWEHGPEKLKEFAEMNQFFQVVPDQFDHYTKITVSWRQRELQVICTEQGHINNIEHRSVRWVSTTFKRYDLNGGDDVRVYLKTNAKLDEDESCLETVVDFLNNRSVFNECFAQQLRTSDIPENFSKRPLISEMFHLNWRFQTMRCCKTILKFVNQQGDKVILRQVYDGVFVDELKEFEWFPKHFEIDLQMHMESRSIDQLVTDSYKMCLALFDFTKINQ